MGRLLVVFEVTLTPEGKDRYLEIAAKLRPLVAGWPGYERGERFRSIAAGDKLLSMHVWESEEAIAAWRKHAEHRLAQLEGREKLFSSYRITVGQIIREYTAKDRDQAPADSNEHLLGDKGC